MLWNPITATMFRVIADGLKPLVHAKSSVVQPSASVRTKESKPKSPPKPVGDVDMEEIRRRIKGVALTKPHLYATPGHPFIKCDKARCRFCQHLFENLNITRCEGHKRCTSVGWYPHVGAPLWQMVRKRHATHDQSTIKPKECKVGEIPALAKAVGTSPVSPMDDSGSRCSTACENEGSVTPTPSSPRSPQSTPKRSLPLSWADDVEEYYLSKRYAKQELDDSA